MKKVMIFLFALFLGAFGYSHYQEAILKAEQRGYEAGCKATNAKCDQRVERLQEAHAASLDSLRMEMTIEHTIQIGIVTDFYEKELSRMEEQFNNEKQEMARIFADSLVRREVFILDSLQQVHATNLAKAGSTHLADQGVEASKFSDAQVVILSIGAYVICLALFLFFVAAMQRLVRRLLGMRV